MTLYKTDKIIVISLIIFVFGLLVIQPNFLDSQKTSKQAETSKTASVDYLIHSNDKQISQGYHLMSTCPSLPCSGDW